MNYILKRHLEDLELNFKTLKEEEKAEVREYLKRFEKWTRKKRI